MQGYQEVTIQELKNVDRQDTKFKLIDVRTQEEFDQVHAEGAIHMPLDQFTAAGVAALGVGKQEPLYLICKAGGRSAQACEILIEAGFEQVFNVAGGTLSWLEENLPTRSGGA